MQVCASAGAQLACGEGSTVGDVGGDVGCGVFVGQVAQHAYPALHIPPATLQRELEPK